MGLARGLAARYRSANEPMDDLVQVASLGLVKAVDRFDSSLGIPFAAFASPTILGELRRHFRDTGWSVHVPRAAKERALALQRATRELTESTGRSPTVVELAGHLELTVELTVDGLEAAQAHYSDSLDAPVGTTTEEETPTVLDRTGADEGGYGLAELSGSLVPALKRLPHLERRALELRLDGDLTQSQIGRELGCSQMQVSRLLRRATGRVREQLELDPA